MYSLLIADDEEMVRRGLAETVDWETLGFRVCGTAKDGAEALDILERREVDVVLADIRMPGLSGLDLAARIRVRHTGTRVVILSGYDDFDYARRAIEHDVFSYLLKPLREERAAEVFARLKVALDAERKESIDLALGRRARLRAAFRQLVTRGESPQALLDMLPTEFSGGLVIIIAPCPGNADLSIMESWRTHLPHLIEGMEGRRGEVVSTSIGDDRMAVLLLSSVESLSSRAEDFFRDIRRRGRELGDLHFVAAGGPIVSTPEGLLNSAREAVDLLGHALYLGKNRLIRSEDAREEGALELPDSRREAERFTDILTARDESSLVSRTDGIFSLMRDACPRNPQALMQWFRSFFYGLEQTLRDRGFDPSAVIGNRDVLLDSLTACRTIGDMRDLFYDRALSGLEATNKVCGSSGHRVVRLAVDTLQNRYSEDVGLETVAEELEVSAPYLSRLFKSEMGVNFKEYLTRIRLDKARELLRKTSMRIYEVSAAAGYPDQKYFCEIFKKRTGMTPREYRRDVRPPG